MDTVASHHTRIRPRKSPAWGEIRGTGRQGGPGAQDYVEFEGGEGITPAQLEAVSSAFLEERRSILTIYQGAAAMKSLVEELLERDYNLRTFRLSLMLKSANFQQPNVIPLIATRPGVLHSRWARVEHNGPDTCVSWQKPCLRADASLLMGFFSERVYPASFMRTTAAYQAGNSFLETIDSLGFDIKSLRITVKKRLEK